jgi:hypothetical protein
MRLKPYIHFILALILFSTLKGHSQSKDISIILKNLYDRILYSNNDVEKLRLNDSIHLLIDNYVTSDSVFVHKFSNLRYLGQITSPDSKLKIINWNLILRDGSNKYFCYLIRKGEKGKGNKVYKLNGSHSDNPIKTNRSYSEKDWYGALYYAIKPYKNDYVVLGIDNSSLFQTRKIIDVLSFTPEGGLLFGKSCFIKGKETKLREVLEYSSEGVVSLRFKSQKLIVFDHLDVFSAGHENNTESYGAGLSFDGYKLKKGNWEFISNIDAKNVRDKK